MGTDNPMDDRARQALCDIVDREGVGVLVNLPRVEAMLGDLCPGAAGEIHSLLAAGKAGAARSLERSTNEQLPGVVAALSAKLADSYGMTRSVADWAAMSWLIAARPRAAATMLAAALATASSHTESPASGPGPAAAAQEPASGERLPQRVEPAPAGQAPLPALVSWAPSWPLEPAPAGQPLLPADVLRSDYVGRWIRTKTGHSTREFLVVELAEEEGLAVLTSAHANAGEAASRQLFFRHREDSNKFINFSQPFFCELRLTAPSRLCLTRGRLVAEYERA